MEKYFAYGPNLCQSLMSDRCPGSLPAFRARLEDHALEFTVYSPKKGSAAADAVPRSGETVCGGVYEVTEEDLALLDVIEGCPYLYERTRVAVVGDDGVRHEAWTHQAATRAGPFEPSEGYLELLIEGAEEWQLPESYLAFLRSHEHEEDHDHDH